MEQPAPQKLVRLRVTAYKGRDPARQAQYQADLELAHRIETLLTERRQAGQHTFTAFDIADALGVEQVAVRRILQQNGGGNGITV